MSKQRDFIEDILMRHPHWMTAENAHNTEQEILGQLDSLLQQKDKEIEQKVAAIEELKERIESMENTAYERSEHD